MAELSDNVRWLVTNLIDQDQRICVELQRRGEEYTAAGRLARRWEREPCRRFPRLRLPRTVRAGRRRLRHRRNQ